MSRVHEVAPIEALARISHLARGDTGGSDAARRVLRWLVLDDGGYQLRRLDGVNRAAMMDIIEWWAGPLWSEQPLHDVIKDLVEPAPSPPAE